MITPPGLRLVRTSMLGYMPGWCPQIHPTGPYRPVSLSRDETGAPRHVRIRGSLDPDGTGRLQVSFAAAGLEGPVLLSCAGAQAPLQRGEAGFAGELAIPGVEAWWPRSHGRPALHEVEIVSGESRRRIGRTGFRRIAIDRGGDGRDFAVLVNGQRIFCRGAAWTSAGIVDLPGDRAAYEPLLRLAAEAGMNMLRLSGVTTYETEAFFDLCDELGIMVWQDFMFANFHYPDSDPDFIAQVRQEVEQVLDRHAASPSLAILCGGSEMAQQAAMLGLPPDAWSGPLTDEILPELAGRLRPDAPYLPNTPGGGAMPFSPNAGVTHYYGVGAYCRPIEDARRAQVRFATECLAFANVPEQRTLDAHLPAPAVHDPRWKARVPRDRGASWDFEDVRDHYLAALYGCDPARMRREDPERYLDLSRAVSGEVMEAVFAEWRRPGSSCNGALVWTFQDLLPGAGWGVVDATGAPKPAYFALKRAFRPVQVTLTDEGTNGVDIHLLNETGAPRNVTLELACLRDGAQPVLRGSRSLTLAARQGLSIAATEVFGAFFDTSYAFRFGPPSHDVVTARLRDAEAGDVLAEAFHFPLGRLAAMEPATLAARLERDVEGWKLVLSANRLAQSVHIDAPGFRPSDNWFHLAPGDVSCVRLVEPLAGQATPSGQATPNGIVRAVNAAPIHFDAK
jgi:beta-mannosidase